MDTQNPSRDFPGEFRLDVEDFGPIAKASVDLRPLTLFIGPSNTGKSYLATLVYALYQCFHVEEYDSYKRNYRYIYDLLDSVVDSLLNSDESSSSMLDEFREWVMSNSDTKSRGNIDDSGESTVMLLTESKINPSESQASLPQSVESYIGSVFESLGRHDFHSERRIGRCFGVDSMGQLVRRLSASTGANIKCSIPRMNGLGMFRYELNLRDDGADLSCKLDQYGSLSSDIRELGDLDNSQSSRIVLAPWKRVEREDVVFLLAQLIEDLFMWFLRPLHRESYYLPASRTGVIHSHKVVVGALVQSATTAGRRVDADIPVLSGVLGDFLNQLLEMDGNGVQFGSRTKQRSARGIEALATGLERGVLKGVVQMQEVGSGYPRFDFLPDGWSEALPLIQASSMVSELAPVVLYLRHLVRPGDVLIIEEPESHLHPAMQVEIMRQIAGLVRAGIRVIVTTHSEWLLQELANLVQLSQLPEAEREGIAGADVTLESEQVGAWLFEPQASGEGSTVREIGLDESGLYPAGFDDVAAAMHNDWAEILSRRGDHE